MKTSESMTALVERARNPDASLQDRHDAFTLLVQRSQHLVFALALTRLRDVEESKDASQDAFAMAWRRLSQLRDPTAFEPWLKSIVISECSSRSRRRAPVPDAAEMGGSVESDADRLDYASVVAVALDTLPAGERRVTVLFYYLGYTQPQIARLLRLKPGTVGKRLHSARLRMRRGLPRSVRSEFVRIWPSPAFAERVRRGLLDEYTGEYRFETRPDHVVTIRREDDRLVSESAGQRHLLVSGATQSLLTSHYDGEGRFRRDRRGRVTHFVYYEFGKRLGVARKVEPLDR